MAKAILVVLLTFGVLSGVSAVVAPAAFAGGETTGGHVLRGVHAVFLMGMAAH